MPWRIVLLVLSAAFVVASAVDASGFVRGSQRFEARILDVFSKDTRYEHVERLMRDNVLSRLVRSKIDLQSRADHLQLQISDYVEKKMTALRQTVDIAEASAVSTRESSEQPVYYDVKSGEKEIGPTGVHIPLDVYDGGRSVLRDIRWTGWFAIRSRLQQNVAQDATIMRQYISTSEGVTRLHPAKPWNLHPRGYTVDLFDPRSRPWYVNAVSAPKDVLFLVDFSGSGFGQTLRLSKLLILRILAMLSPHDFINAVWFNKQVGHVVPCAKGFIPATTRNKLDVADIGQALNYTFTEFVRAEGGVDGERTSGGHRIVMLFTDSIEAWAKDVMRAYAPAESNANVTVRFFGYAMGHAVKDMHTLRWMSCVNKGYYTVVNRIGDVRNAARAFLSVLQRPLALSMQGMPTSRRPVTWTGPYMDAQGEGAVVTLSMPLLDTYPNGSRQHFNGVSGIDIKISEIQRRLGADTLGSDSYVFAVDNTGTVLFHPKQKIPSADIQLVRRTACFPLTESSMRTSSSSDGSGKRKSPRVLFGTINQRSMQQQGFIDSIFHIDLLEVEPVNAATRALRRAMIGGECDHTVFESTDAQYRYTCRRVLGTPYSIALATSVRLEAETIEFDFDGESETTQEISLSPLAFPSASEHSARMFTTRLPPKILSTALDLSTEILANRTMAHVIASECVGGGQCDKYFHVTRRLVNEYRALEPWMDSFPRQHHGLTCRQVFEESATSSSDLTFVQTSTGASYIYPACPSMAIPDALLEGENLSPFFRDFADEVLSGKPIIHVTPGSEVNVGAEWFSLSKPIFEETFIGAIVGTFVKVDRLHEWWSEVTDEAEMTDECARNGKRCYLMDSTVNVLSSSSSDFERWSHLSDLDGQLFMWLLANESVLNSATITDYQAECVNGSARRDYFVSSAPSLSLRGVLHSIVALLHGVFVRAWYGVALPLFALVLPTEQGAARLDHGYVFEPFAEKLVRRPCEYGRASNWTQACIMRRQVFTFKEGVKYIEGAVISNDHLHAERRPFTLVRMNKTDLFVISIDIPVGLPNSYPVPAQYQLVDYALDECRALEEARAEREQRAPSNTIYTMFHAEEDASMCSASALHGVLVVPLFVVYVFHAVNM